MAITYLQRAWRCGKLLMLPALLGCAMLMGSCGKEQEEDGRSPLAEERSGEELAQVYCRSCHAYTEPGLLDRQPGGGRLPRAARALAGSVATHRRLLHSERAGGACCVAEERGAHRNESALERAGFGDEDIVLGSFIGFAPEGDATGLMDRWTTSSPSVVLLENQVE